MKRIKGMKEFFLGAFLAGNELYIINEQNIDRAILLTKRLSGMRTNGVDQIVGEFLR